MVDIKDNSLKSVFNYTCQGESDESTKFHLKHLNRPVKDVCKTQGVRIAFNQDTDFQYLENNNAMYTDFPVSYSILFGSYPYEILTSFFTSHNLTPTWQDANYTWGSWDEETGLWTGAVGLVSRTGLLEF